MEKNGTVRLINIDEGVYMAKTDILEQGREAFRNKAWNNAFSLLSSADNQAPLEPSDLDLYAKAAYLAGKDAACADIWIRAHQGFLHKDEVRQASVCAFWLGMILFNQGKKAQGSGWIARARRLISDYRQDCLEQGLLLIPEALQHLSQADAEKAHELFSKAAEIGQRVSNPELATLGRLGRGQALIHLSKIAEGITLLDEAMIAVVSDEVSPIVSGIVYCAVIDTCQKIFDLRRAQEWTTALSQWCDSQPDLIPYRGQCLVRRAEIMQLHGEWADALHEIGKACDLSQASSPPATGEAYYRRGELYRLCGEFTKAEEAYRQASKWGREPQPGLALLRLAQGQIDASTAAIRRLEKEKQNPLTRSKILPAYIDILLTEGDYTAAQHAAAELSEIALEFDAPFLQAIAARAQGSILLAKGEPGKALKKLLPACKITDKVKAPYESAGTRVLVGIAYRELGDNDTAKMELDAARSIFQQLGATHDLNKVDLLMRHEKTANTHGLTPREMDVLRLLATGKTNKTIATELYISERTVDRHVSNILGKLEASSRAAATAYAYKHGLI